MNIPVGSLNDGAPSPEGDGPGPTLFRFVRHWSRRWLSPSGLGVDRDNARDVWVTEAVRDRQGAHGASVNEVADELGIDQSGASRLIAQAADRGFLRKEDSPADARRRVLVVTEEGRELLRTAHAWQESVFADLTADWPDRDVRELHRLMRLLVRAQHAAERR
ncbi:winged helix-turn-helix transcriptional regulator [Streptomonospora sp. PA3]|uniref:MarR family winged helix-turn-helix transcriptional regulator n=1 Tax=Streptomonospora sp. PA3 TaxID=2607326 RepID=UPI0012DF8BCF|nr:MarR family winged helix-turn-helix transcriptional regulator [Streptomonospora sp. PA3]MUL42441.1 winged helix-turn-helix transcriptional regulator [Streptomonospora sp. PA3]